MNEQMPIKPPRSNDNAEISLEENSRNPNNELLYTVEEVPPWYLCIVLGFQHFLMAFSASIPVPMVLSKYLCLDKDAVGLGELIGTLFFVSGIVTLIQAAFGIRLPIVQGGTFAILTPTIAILSSPKWKCPYIDVDEGKRNITELPDIGSTEHREIWYTRIREIQGAIMVASIFEVLVGFSGLMGVCLKYIGPMSITPTVTLIGLTLFPEAANLASKQWYIAFVTIFLILLFSHYLQNVGIPLCRCNKGEGAGRLYIFKLFPILLAILLVWLLCAVLTAAGAFPSSDWGYQARTDIKSDSINDALWFRFPYPGQWGLPTITVASVFGILAGIIASMIESVGDYYAYAKLSGAPPPPPYAVGSRSVVQVCGIFMILFGCFGKFGAVLVTIPDPVIGGVFFIVFGVVCAAGLSNLQFVDLNSSRNLFILGTSLFSGLSFPIWINKHHDSINTGSEVVDQITIVLLSSGMFVGGFIGFALDNTVPGTVKERGIDAWRSQKSSTEADEGFDTTRVYDLPLIQKYLDRMACSKFLPVCPGFQLNHLCCCKREEEKSTEIQQ